MLCPWCKSEFQPKKHGQRFCRVQCKIAFHNREKANAITIPECFRSMTERLATAQQKTITEMAALIYSAGLKWEETGKPLTQEQIFGK